MTAKPASAAGTTHSLKLEFHTGVPNARVRLIWDVGADREWRAQIAEAVALARRSSVAVVVAGIEEGEFRDRSSLALPGHQEELITAVAATGKPTIVVLVGGSAITMSRWIDDVEAVLMAWYPGQDGGTALGQLLSGRLEPGGRSPITFPVSEGQLPLYYDHRPTGRGDDYVDGTGEPLFPFGFGLSYTTFAYSGLRVTADGTLPITITFTVTNTGSRSGTAVAHLRPIRHGWPRLMLRGLSLLGTNQGSELDRQTRSRLIETKEGQRHDFEQGPEGGPSRAAAPAHRPRATW